MNILFIGGAIMASGCVLVASNNINRRLGLFMTGIGAGIIGMATILMKFIWIK